MSNEKPYIDNGIFQTVNQLYQEGDLGELADLWDGVPNDLKSDEELEAFAEKMNHIISILDSDIEYEQNTYTFAEIIPLMLEGRVFVDRNGEKIKINHRGQISYWDTEYEWWSDESTIDTIAMESTYKEVKE